jgi:hypothetical protein
VNELRLEIVFANPLQVARVTAPAIGFQFLTIWFENFKVITKGNHVMYTLPVDHLVNMQVSYVDAKGNKATVDGDVSWESSDESIIMVAADSGDSTICRATPVGSIGQAQITATCDADLGDGVRELINTADISVVAGEAVAGSIQPIGEPEEIAPHAEPRA